MRKSNISIKRVNYHSFVHNAREEEKPAKTVYSQYTQENECTRTAQEARELFNNLYRDSIAKLSANRKTARENTLIEAVINLKDTSSMDEVQKLSNHIKEKFGFTPLQIAIHRDEGHLEGEKLERNYHAHLTFFTLDQESGKQLYRGENIKINRLKELHTETAQILGMQRGQKNSQNKRLEHKQLKEHNRRLDPYLEHIKELKQEKIDLQIIQSKKQKQIEKLEQEKEEQDRQYQEQLQRIKNNHQKELKKQIDDTNRLLRQILKDNNAKRLDYAELEQTIKEVRELAQNEETAQQSISRLIREKEAIQERYSQEKEQANEKVQESKLFYNGFAKSLNNMLIEFGWENVKTINELKHTIQKSLQEKDKELEKLENKLEPREKQETTLNQSRSIMRSR